MFTPRRTPWLMTAALALSLFLTACDDDDVIDPGDDVERFQVEIINVQDQTQGAPFPVFKSGAFDTPAGADGPGPIAPGGAYEVGFTIGPDVTPGSGARLSFATMFIQSNDLFYAFRPEGLALYDEEGTPLGADGPADVTGEVFLYDAGTEVNEEPGTGPNQAPRQSGPDTGEDENGTVQPIGDVDDGYDYPAAQDVIRVVVTHEGGPAFTLRIENVSEGTTVNGQPIPLSPGAWAVHSESITFYEVGAAASEGIERIAEDGQAAPYAEALAPVTGITVPLSPGAWAVHSGAVQLFAEGETASEGIEAIAEDGSPAALAAALDGLSGVEASGVFNTPEGADAPGPIGPGGRYAFEVEAEPGDRLSLATMYVQSNDLYYAFQPEGLALFGADGMPASGDMTAEVVLYDAGTEVDEEPGVGLTQVIRQSGPDAGEDEGGTVTRIGDGGTDSGYTYPPNAQIIRIVITPR